ncbi:MAG: WG repeat-containing protein, partial [Bacteroidota bacterium]
MKFSLSCLLLLLLFCNTAHSQSQIEGTYDSKKRVFSPSNNVYRVYDFRDGLAKFRTNDKYGVIDTTGKVIVPMKYEEIEPFLDGVARVEIFGDYPTHYGYIDKQGIEV